MCAEIRDLRAASCELQGAEGACSLPPWARLARPMAVTCRPGIRSSKGFGTELLYLLPRPQGRGLVMASTMRSAAASALIAAVAISSVGVALAHGDHAHAPAPGPASTSAAAGFLPGSIFTSLVVTITGFIAARCL
ncbi:hypothetical protein AXG93_209s1020 [Marchantia polymorpha subsp. ruderalis]|uniref:Uncharacterized protein n=2 Tax=Marchantia polymorpha TaxID=3197 RepID=A0A176VK62_MARPO|nr:hypothetical protein AXG93_209s1020 [Marchantia polymorpha subsp. ruderalis]